IDDGTYHFHWRGVAASLVAASLLEVHHFKQDGECEDRGDEGDVSAPPGHRNHPLSPHPARHQRPRPYRPNRPQSRDAGVTQTTRAGKTSNLATVVGTDGHFEKDALDGRQRVWLSSQPLLLEMHLGDAAGSHQEPADNPQKKDFSRV